jgi:hypothetical protein
VLEPLGRWLKFDTLTGEFEKQPYQFVGPLQEFPAVRTENLNPGVVVMESA